MRAITAAQLAQLLRETDEPPVVLDVREPWELAVASLPEAVAIPMQSIPGALDRLDPQRTTVCVCHHGARSLQVALFLEHHGFRDVVNLTGGIHAWSEQVDSSVPTY
jgi:rhodanese-related sulfurtransferase